MPGKPSQYGIWSLLQPHRQPAGAAGKCRVNFLNFYRTPGAGPLLGRRRKLKIPSRSSLSALLSGANSQNLRLAIFVSVSVPARLAGFCHLICTLNWNSRHADGTCNSARAQILTINFYPQDRTTRVTSALPYFDLPSDPAICGGNEGECIWVGLRRRKRTSCHLKLPSSVPSVN